jgi:hypothetical protein
MIEELSPWNFFRAEAHDMRGGLLAVDDVVWRRMMAKCLRSTASVARALG